MTKPKNMTPEQEADFKRRDAESSRRWREKNPDKAKAAFRKWHQEWAEKNPDKLKESNRLSEKRARDRDIEAARQKEREKRDKNPERAREYSRQYYHANKDREKELRKANGNGYGTEEYNKKHRARQRKRSEKLVDSYVAERLGLPVESIPKALIQAKRTSLKTTRTLKQIKKLTNENDINETERRN